MNNVMNVGRLRELLAPLPYDMPVQVDGKPLECGVVIPPGGHCILLEWGLDEDGGSMPVKVICLFDSSPERFCLAGFDFRTALFDDPDFPIDISDYEEPHRTNQFGFLDQLRAEARRYNDGGA